MAEDNGKLGFWMTAGQVFLSLLSVVKDLVWTGLILFAQSERAKNKKLEDELELMKTEKAVENEIKKLDEKKQNTDPGDGIDDFLQS